MDPSSFLKLNSLKASQYFSCSNQLPSCRCFLKQWLVEERIDRARSGFHHPKTTQVSIIFSLRWITSDSIKSVPGWKRLPLAVIGQGQGSTWTGPSQLQATESNMQWNVNMHVLKWQYYMKSNFFIFFFFRALQFSLIDKTDPPEVKVY